MMQTFKREKQKLKTKRKRNTFTPIAGSVQNNISKLKETW
jgi:hypothetical protein